MHFKLEPNRGANPLVFGQNRNKVRRLLNNLVFSTKTNEPENDFYRKEGIILGYDEKDELEFVEIIPPSSAELENIQIFELNLPDLLAKVRSLGFPSSYENGGYNFSPIGLAIYCPREKVESVSLYREGYYS